MTLMFILLITLTMGNADLSHQETKSLNSDKIKLITVADNNTFSDLSRNMSMQTGS